MEAIFLFFETVRANPLFCALLALAGASIVRMGFSWYAGRPISSLGFAVLGFAAFTTALMSASREQVTAHGVHWAITFAVCMAAGSIILELTCHLITEVVGFFSRRGTRQLSQELAAKQAADRAKNGAS